MFLRESIRHCPECDEVAPHSQRRVALPKIVAAASLAGAVASGWAGSEWFFLGGALLVASVLIFLSDRERFWHMRCERCRTRLLVELRRTKPTLDGHAEINIS